ncbi:MAG: hypothetical protein H6Q52_1122 [Deltaproteobacteria bacterium]|nr:hypothetical protein [Deltaproteobacteria bacterium]
MLTNSSFCRPCDEDDDLSISSLQTKNNRKLFIAETSIPAESTETAVQTDNENLFCHFHPRSFLELRFTARHEIYRGCPECEKEEYFRRYGVSDKKLHGF